MEEIDLRWSQGTVDKIYKKHGITPEEVQEVIYQDKPFFRRGPSAGKSRCYYVLGQSSVGRYLLK